MSAEHTEELWELTTTLAQAARALWRLVGQRLLVDLIQQAEAALEQGLNAGADFRIQEALAVLDHLAALEVRLAGVPE